MTMTVHVDIVSAESAIFSGLAEMVTAPALMGEVGIAPRHAPMLSPMRPGDVKLKLPNGEEEHYYVSGGMLEVQPHLVTILSDTCIRAHDLDEAKAMEAKKRAEEILERQQSGKETAIAEHELADAVAQLRTISKLRGRT